MRTLSIGCASWDVVAMRSSFIAAADVVVNPSDQEGLPVAATRGARPRSAGGCHIRWRGSLRGPARRDRVCWCPPAIPRRWRTRSASCSMIRETAASMGKAGRALVERTTASPPWSTKWKTSTAGYSGGERGERDHHHPPVPGRRSRRGPRICFARLSARPLSSRRTPELFAWKHIDNPFGRSIILVAEAEGTIAGLRAFMRWELTTPGGEIAPLCSGGGHRHPPRLPAARHLQQAHRGRGRGGEGRWR